MSHPSGSGPHLPLGLALLPLSAPCPTPICFSSSCLLARGGGSRGPRALTPGQGLCRAPCSLGHILVPLASSQGPCLGRRGGRKGRGRQEGRCLRPFPQEHVLQRQKQCHGGAGGGRAWTPAWTSGLQEAGGPRTCSALTCHTTRPTFQCRLSMLPNPNLIR